MRWSVSLKRQNVWGVGPRRIGILIPDRKRATGRGRKLLSGVDLKRAGLPVSLEGVLLREGLFAVPISQGDPSSSHFAQAGLLVVVKQDFLPTKGLQSYQEKCPPSRHTGYLLLSFVSVEADDFQSLKDAWE